MNATGTRSRVRSRAGAAVLAFALVSVSAASGPSAFAASGGWWYDTYDIGAVHAQGLTGDGVEVASLGAQINADLPVFAGQNLTVADEVVCADGGAAVSTEPTRSIVHDTTVVAYINGNGTGTGEVRGIAPGAAVSFYANGPASDAGCFPAQYPDDLTTFGWGLQRAVDDGARIVTTSTTSQWSAGDAEAVANAVAKGVIVVVATPNPSTASPSGYPEGYNGVVAASAVDSAGALQVRDDGSPQALADTTVVAAGSELPAVGDWNSATWDTSLTGTGSSFASPLVAGMLAVVAQRYPEATGNQLIQTLIHNTGVDDHPLERDETGGYGYGAAWLTHMLAVDPTQYPDVNPLMDKSSGAPSDEQVAAAAARDFALPFAETPTADATPSDSFAEYGDDAAAEPDVGDAAFPALLPIILIVVALIVAGGIILVVVMTNARKKKNLQGGPS
ncbi:S8 family serine peptidase [Microbacterium sp. P07]|uniref:S8 family serine peptidase n=1 Tax=Microbacterium sp. P07 TaxID=3366952 RepID=UPI0037475C56